MKPRLLIMIPFMLFFASLILFPMATAADFSPSLPKEYEGVYLVINKGNNTLYVYLNDRPTYRFKIATGKHRDLTPEGLFKIVTKVKNPWYKPKQIPGGDPTNPLGTRWLGLNVPQTNGYKYGIHGTNRPGSIGLNISQGCVRMRNKDVEWLFKHIPLHTPVLIVNEL